MSEPIDGGSLSNQDKSPEGGFIEQRIFVPRQLWSRVASTCKASGKEPSELVADALRLLLAGGIPAAAASVSGTASEPASADADPAAPVSTDDISAILEALRGEPIDSTRLREQLTRIMSAVEEKDSSIDKHSESVADLARRLAETIGMSADEIQVIELGALVHDLGKSQIPDEILSKRGRLTQEEWALVKRYPEFSAEMLTPIVVLADVVPIVRHHQERWDASGYPDGLLEEAIPVGAQIIGICDVYRVLTSERAYRPALSPEIARRTIEAGSGRLWNPDLAEALLKKVMG